MNKIEFNQTSNIFVNAGIIGLHRYINKYIDYFPEKFEVTKNELLKNKLIVECSKLLELLEEVYYFMGKEIYDTATQKQLDEAKNKKANFYYNIEKEKFYPFPKMNTYGLTHLLTNNAQGVTRNEENSLKIEQLEKTQPELAQKFHNFFEDNKLKLLSKIYFNEPYTKITRLNIDKDFFKEGKENCPIINEPFKKLVEGKNISPFIGGMANFNTFLTQTDRKISWKALYLIRFSPVMAYYHYKDSYETLICNFFNSNNLQNINSLYNDELFISKNELEKTNYLSNFKFFDFKYLKKDSEEYLVKSTDDAVSASEISFLLLYTFYKRHFELEIKKTEDGDEIISNPFEDHPFAKIPISIITFKASKFASTMRPNEFEEFNNVKYIFRLIYETECRNKIKISEIWSGLKMRSPKSEMLKFDKKRKEERKIRTNVFKKVLKGKPITNEIEELFYDCYKYKIENFDSGFRKYKDIMQFLIIYEQSLKTNNMEKELQLKAINLGKSIGQSILRFENDDKKTNAKSGRKYLIGIHKSRSLIQFMDNLYRVVNKYQVSTSNDILENINDDNFQLIRQFVLISALNQINSVL